MVVAANEKARTIFPCGKVGIVFSVLPSLLSLSLSHPLALFRHENFTHSFNLISSAWICSDATWDARQVQCLWRWTKDRYAPCAWQTKDWKNYCAGLSSGLFSIVFRSIKAAAIFFSTPSLLRQNSSTHFSVPSITQGNANDHVLSHWIEWMNFLLWSNGFVYCVCASRLSLASIQMNSFG